MSMQPMFKVEGMTLRDWFAGQALAGRVARADPASAAPSNTELAAWAYAMAQEMMAQRERMFAEEEKAMWGPDSER